MSEKFETWAVVELFGHTRLAGRLTVQEVGGASFIRLDVPETNGQPEFCKLLGPTSIYSITPCSEEVARKALEYIHPTPIPIYMPELRQLPASDREFDDDFDEDDDRPF